MTKRVTKRDGEVIELVGGDDHGDDHYVRGHMPPAEAKEILDAHYDDLNHDVASIKASYGRWSCRSDGEDPDWPVCLEDYTQPGPGRFRVMVCTEWRDFTNEELVKLRAELAEATRKGKDLCGQNGNLLMALKNIRNVIGPKAPDPKLGGAAEGMAAEIARALEIITEAIGKPAAPAGKGE